MNDCNFIQPSNETYTKTLEIKQDPKDSFENDNSIKKSNYEEQQKTQIENEHLEGFEKILTKIYDLDKNLYEKVEEIKNIRKIKLILIGSEQTGKKTFEKNISKDLEINFNSVVEINFQNFGPFSKLNSIPILMRSLPENEFPIFLHFVDICDHRLLEEKFFTIIYEAKKQYGNPYFILFFTKLNGLISVLNSNENEEEIDDDESEENFKSLGKNIQNTINFYEKLKINLQGVFFIGKVLKDDFKNKYLETIRKLNQNKEQLYDEMIFSKIKIITHQWDKEFNEKKKKQFENNELDLSFTNHKINFDEELYKITRDKENLLIAKIYSHLDAYINKLDKDENFSIYFHNEKNAKNVENYLNISIDKIIQENFENLKKELKNSNNEDDIYRKSIKLTYATILQSLHTKLKSDKETLYISEEIRKLISNYNKPKIEDLKTLNELQSALCDVNQKIQDFFKKYVFIEDKIDKNNFTILKD